MKTHEITVAPALTHAVVLLSGGMDSVAALHWAREKQPLTLRAIGFAYGQPNRDHELTAARGFCDAMGVQFEYVAASPAMPKGAGILKDGAPLDHDPEHLGLSRAFVPGRNAIFLTLAAAFACRWSSAGTIDLVIGANKDDSQGFPDCRPNFMVHINRALSVGYGREFNIRTPFIDRTKRQILAMSSDAAKVDIARSWSCYRSEGPCGVCTPCVLRREAFDSVGLVDECVRVTMGGGDRHRSW